MGCAVLLSINPELFDSDKESIAGSSFRKEWWLHFVYILCIRTQGIWLLLPFLVLSILVDTFDVISSTFIELFPLHLSSYFLHTYQVPSTLMPLFSSTLIRLFSLHYKFFPPDSSSYFLHTYQVISTTLIKLFQQQLSSHDFHPYRVIWKTIIPSSSHVSSPYLYLYHDISTTNIQPLFPS